MRVYWILRESKECELLREKKGEPLHIYFLLRVVSLIAGLPPTLLYPHLAPVVATIVYLELI